MELKIGQRSHTVKVRDEKTGRLTEAHNRANERHPNNRRTGSRPMMGSVRLSNTSSIAQANRLRQRLMAKMREVTTSGVEPEVAKAHARTVQMQVDRVDRTIRQIRRRERAQEEEKRDRARQEQTEDRRTEQHRLEERRRRRSDMRERSVRIRRDMLSPASQGGFDPRNVQVRPDIGQTPAVSYNVAGSSGTVADTSAADVAVDILM